MLGNQKTIGAFADDNSYIDLEGAEFSGFDQTFIASDDSTILIKNTTVDGTAEP